MASRGDRRESSGDKANLSIVSLQTKKRHEHLLTMTVMFMTSFIQHRPPSRFLAGGDEDFG